MRRTTLGFTFAMVMAALATPAVAQDRPLHFILGGGYTAPTSEIRDHLGDGWNFTIGAQVNVTPVIGIEGVYGYNGLGDKRISIPVSGTPGGSTVPTDFFGHMNMQYGLANLVVQSPHGGVKPYGVVGGGVYYRPVKVTTPGVGYIPGYCDPWWYVCTPGGFVPVDNVIGERSSTDFGMDFGGGLKFGAFFTDLRYHYIWGPTIKEPTTGTTTSDRKANGQFFIWTFGIRY
jgi:opacity protein-like surface antigen